MPRFRVVITDYDYGDTAIERAILEPIGAEVVALQAKSEDDLAGVAPDCDAMINQYARVGAQTIALMRRCRVIARYGVGVDIVDVEAATAKGDTGHQCPRLLHGGGCRPRHRALADAGAQDRRRTTAPLIRVSGTGRRANPFIACAAERRGSCPSARSARRSPSAPRRFGVELLVYDPFIGDDLVAAQGGSPESARRNCSPVPMSSSCRFR